MPDTRFVVEDVSVPGVPRVMEPVVIISEKLIPDPAVIEVTVPRYDSAVKKPVICPDVYKPSLKTRPLTVDVPPSVPSPAKKSVAIKDPATCSVYRGFDVPIPRLVPVNHRLFEPVKDAPPLKNAT